MGVPRVTGTVYVSAHGSFSDVDAGEKQVPRDMPGVKGVFVGGCIETGIGRLSPKSECAHAHTSGQRKGWVCFQLPEYLDDLALRMHELAHIQTGEGHTRKWCEAMEKLGQEVPARYLSRVGRAKR